MKLIHLVYIISFFVLASCSSTAIVSNHWVNYLNSNSENSPLTSSANNTLLKTSFKLIDSKEFHPKKKKRSENFQKIISSLAMGGVCIQRNDGTVFETLGVVVKSKTLHILHGCGVVLQQHFDVTNFSHRQLGVLAIVSRFHQAICGSN